MIGMIPFIFYTSTPGGGAPSYPKESLETPEERQLSSTPKEPSQYLKRLEQKALNSLSESQQKIFKQAISDENPYMITSSELYDIVAVNEYFFQRYIEWSLDSPPRSRCLSIRYLALFIHKITRPFTVNEREQILEIFDKALGGRDQTLTIGLSLAEIMISQYERIPHSTELLKKLLINSCVRFNLGPALFFAEELTRRGEHDAVYEEPVEAVLESVIYMKSCVDSFDFPNIPKISFPTTTWLQRLFALKPKPKIVLRMYESWYDSLSGEQRQCIANYLRISPAVILK